MFIKQLTIQGLIEDIEIARTDDGALVTVGNRVVCEVLRRDDRERWRDHATNVAALIYGRHPRRPDQVQATGSMIFDVQCLLERVAGC